MGTENIFNNYYYYFLLKGKTPICVLDKIFTILKYVFLKKERKH